MKYHYRPAVNVAEFNRMAEACDSVLIKRRAKDIVKQRNALLRELSDLRYKPRRTLDEDMSILVGGDENPVRPAF